MRILFVGDTHGDVQACKTALEYATVHNCTYILILGDFEFFPNLKEYINFINELSVLSIQYGITIHWIRGNHENHRVLEDLCGNSVDIIEITQNIFYHPNGNVWRWDGVTFLAMGGAWSIDRSRRTYGVDWFPGEQISQEDIRKAYHVGFVDVLVSHDSPFTSNLDDFLDFYLYPEAQENRRKLQSVVESIRPKINFHGHFHQRFTGYANYTDDNDNVVEFKTIGLDCNYGRKLDMFYIFDTSEFKKEHNIEY